MSFPSCEVPLTATNVADPHWGVSMRSRRRIQIITSIRIRIQEAKPILIPAVTDPDPGQTLLSEKVGFLHEKYTLCLGDINDKT
jgi:hypothetical protein